MPSYNTKGEPIDNAFIVTKQPATAATGITSDGGGGMGCGGNPQNDCGCCQAVVCAGISLTVLVLIVKYTC